MDVRAVLKPVLFLAIFGGVCNTRDFPKYPAFVVSLNLITTVANCAHFFAIPWGIIYIENVSNQPHETNQHFIIKILNPCLISAVSLCCRLSVLYQIYKQSCLPVQQLQDVDNLLEPAPTRSHKTNSSVKLFCVFTLILTWPFQIFSYVRITLTSSTTATNFLIFFLNIYNNFSATCCELTFVALSFLIYRRFKLVHANLRRLGHVFRNKKMRGDAGPAVLSRVLLLRECQHVLCEACDKLNRIYNFQLFVSLSSLFVNVLLNLYFAIFGGFAQPESQYAVTQYTSNVVNSVLWSFYYFARFAMICAVADLLIREANSTKIHVCDVMRYCPDRDIKQELWSFLHYAGARKVKFSAFGFFHVDLRLITTAVATGSTYLVILAQFNKE